jgi:hypothetical protein
MYFVKPFDSSYEHPQLYDKIIFNQNCLLYLQTPGGQYPVLCRALQAGSCRQSVIVPVTP